MQNWQLLSGFAAPLPSEDHDGAWEARSDGGIGREVEGPKDAKVPYALFKSSLSTGISHKLFLPLTDYA